MAEWKSKIVPAAKREGEVIWYSCAQATDAEGTIKLFNKTYPDIQVSQVLGPGYQLVEKISTEAGGRPAPGGRLSVRRAERADRRVAGAG